MNDRKRPNETGWSNQSHLPSSWSTNLVIAAPGNKGLLPFPSTFTPSIAGSVTKPLSRDDVHLKSRLSVVPASPSLSTMPQLAPHPSLTHPTSTKPTPKHPIDLTVDAVEDAFQCHKKRRDSMPDHDDDSDLLFSRLADRPEAMSQEKHSKCFTHNFLILLSNSVPRINHPLILTPPRPLVGMTVHPLNLLKPTKGQFNVAGKRMFLSIDQSGLSHRFLQKQRFIPPPRPFTNKVTKQQ